MVEPLDYSALGDFAGGGSGPAGFYHDADGDRDIDLVDYANFQDCLDTTEPACLAVHDFDDSGTSDGDIDGDDFARFQACMDGPYLTPDPLCAMGARRSLPASGSFTLHGRPVDVLADGHTLLYVRARYYDPRHARWLQRDPAGFIDSANLYESFGANPQTYRDPFGFAVDTVEVLKALYAGYPEQQVRWQMMAAAGWTFRFGETGWFRGCVLDWEANTAVLRDTTSPQTAAARLHKAINKFYSHNRGQYAARLIAAGYPTEDIVQAILERGGGYLTAEQKALYAYEVAQLDAATSQIRHALKVVGLTAVAIVWEPADWAITIQGWAQGEFSYYDLAVLLPLVPGTGGKAFRLVSESGDEVARIDKADVVYHTKYGPVGPHSKVGGHHVHMKAAFQGHVRYDSKRGFSISQEYMQSRGWQHQEMTAEQRRLFRELAESGRPNTMREHSRIAVEALMASGATREEARALVAQSLQSLRAQGVTAPASIPWPP